MIRAYISATTKAVTRAVIPGSKVNYFARYFNTDEKFIDIEGITYVRDATNNGNNLTLTKQNSLLGDGVAYVAFSGLSTYDAVTALKNGVETDISSEFSGANWTPVNIAKYNKVIFKNAGVEVAKFPLNDYPADSSPSEVVFRCVISSAKGTLTNGTLGEGGNLSSTNGLSWNFEKGFSRGENLLKYSNTFTNSIWEKFRISISDGKMIEDSSASQTHYIRQFFSLSDNLNYIFSAKVKANGRNWIEVVIANKNTGGYYVYFDLANGVVGTKHAFLTATITADADGYYLITVSFNSATGATSPGVFLFVANADNSNSYTGDGVSGIYIKETQLEQADEVGSYIETDNNIWQKIQYIPVNEGKSATYPALNTSSEQCVQAPADDADFIALDVDEVFYSAGTPRDVLLSSLVSNDYFKIISSGGIIQDMRFFFDLINGMVYYIDDILSSTDYWLAYADSQSNLYFSHKASYSVKIVGAAGNISDMTLPIHPDYDLGSRYNMIRHFSVLRNGKWLCVTKEGGYFRWHSSGDNGATWVTIATNDVGSPNVIGWSESDYGDIVAMTGYGPRGSTKSAFVSLDGGLTAKKIFDAFDPAYGGFYDTETDYDSFHIHSITYDRYWDRLWLMVGDIPASNKGNILYCDNFKLAETPVWNVANTQLDRAIQMAAAYALPDCMLFGSDNGEGNGVWRLDRSVGKDSIHPSDFVLAFDANLKYGDGDGNQTYIVGNFFQKDDNSPLFIAIHKHNAETNTTVPAKKLYSRVIKTTDGTSFTEVFEDTQSRCWWEMGVYSDGNYIYIRPAGNSQNLTTGLFYSTNWYYFKKKI